jgi:hypothetical protein
MSAPKQATNRGLQPHFKVRVVVPGALLHLASWSEPTIGADHVVTADWIRDDPEYGDTIGFIEWDHVVAVTWRFAP